MNGLTKQEITVLTVIAGLLLTGVLVKWYRTSHATPPPVVQNANK